MEVVVGLGAAHLFAGYVVLAETQGLVEVARLAVLGALQEELPGVAVLVVDADLGEVSLPWESCGVRGHSLMSHPIPCLTAA